ncbi:MAG: 4-hydroxy-tetrahydrodipicolinate reductase [Ruminococcaceae bacterium]|nr:4-hydroxy-tetrahydrodipicolinate reductase [Oscillospiraceae bacterium]
MTKILLIGACGKMGHAVANCAADDSNVQIISGIDISEAALGFPVYRKFNDIKVIPDVVIDFSNPALLDSILEFCTANNVPAVLATTGYSDEQIEKIKQAAKSIPVFFTFNMSLGINLLCSLAKKAASVLGDAFDIEIVEKHHNQKLDAPSGTAIMLANAINEEFGETKQYEYDRHSKRQKRPKNEIGIHSIRGGTIVGEHDVIFAGHDEVITLSHSAGSKAVFAAGALKAAKFLATQAQGLYDMADVVKTD